MRSYSWGMFPRHTWLSPWIYSVLLCFSPPPYHKRTQKPIKHWAVNSLAQAFIYKSEEGLNPNHWEDCVSVIFFQGGWTNRVWLYAFGSWVRKHTFCRVSFGCIPYQPSICLEAHHVNKKGGHDKAIQQTSFPFYFQNIPVSTVLGIILYESSCLEVGKVQVSYLAQRFDCK